MGKKIGAIIAFILVAQIFFCGNLFFGTKSYAKEFSDVSSDHWAHEYVDTLSNQGIINGYDDGTFKPSGTITRAEFIKLMVCIALGEEKANGLEVVNNINEDDVEKLIEQTIDIRKQLGYKINSGDYVEVRNSIINAYSSNIEWFTKYTDWSMSNLLTSNYSNEEYKEKITRKEISEILYNYCNYLNLFNDGIIFNSGDNNDSVQELTELEDIIDSLTDEQIKEIIDYLSSIGVKGLNVENIDNKEIADKIKKLDSKKAEDFGEFLLKLSSSNSESENIEEKTKESEKKIEFSDIDSFNENEKKYLEKIVQKGLINGYEDGTYKPDNFMTRAETATVIYRFYNLMNGEKMI